MTDLGERTKFVSVSLFDTSEERDGLLATGMKQGMNDSCAALDKLLAKPN